MQQSFGFFGEDNAGPERLEPLVVAGHRLTIATCGYSYADWVGPFYPPRLRARDRLTYYAERFAAVEIDSSYYRVPSQATFAGMAARTPDDFRFAVKLPGTLTHLPLETQSESHPDAALFRTNLAPLLESGKLTVLLAQFPNGFHPSVRARDHLARLREIFAGLRLAAEFRHREWQTNETLELLESLGIAWTNVDEPHFPTLVRAASDVTTDLAYVRFHGRNYRQWWNPQTSDDRYRYRYSPEELAPWTDRLLEMAERARDTVAFFNNHKFANSAADARQLADLVKARLR